MAFRTREIINIRTIMIKEIQDNIKSLRFLIMGALYFGFALLLTMVNIWLGGGPTDLLTIINGLNIVLALLVVIVSSDAVSSEVKDRTIYQLLSKPVDRSSVIIGKFLGALGVVVMLFGTSTILGYVLTAILTGQYPSFDVLLYGLAGIISMVLILAVYVGIGVFISTLTKNPLISIIGAIAAWIGFWFSGAVGSLLGMLNPQQIIVSGGVLDTFNSNPWYAKVLIWIDPLHHGVMSQLANPDMSQVAVGLPVWANIVFVIAYACLFIVLAILVFEYKDLSS